MLASPLRQRAAIRLIEENIAMPGPIDIPALIVAGEVLSLTEPTRYMPFETSANFGDGP
jgi:hypothetical protein